MQQQITQYGFGTTLDRPVDRAIERVREALAKEGFGVLTEIDVAATLKKKIDVDFRPYVILGACNPSLAHRALTEELNIGLLLPCNVIVYELEPGVSVVAAMDPQPALQLTGNDAIADVAGEARARLTRALDALAAAEGKPAHAAQRAT